MKTIVRTLLILLSICGFAQEKTLDDHVQSLKNQISQSEASKKLKLLDSLTYLIEFNEDYEYSKIAAQTVALAIQLDSLKMATKITADQIYYRTSILNKPKEALEFYKAFGGKEKELKSCLALVNMHLYVGDSYNALGQFDQAIKEFNTAKAHTDILGNAPRTAQALYRIGMTKGSKGLFAEASKDLQSAYSIFSESRDTLNMINAKNSLSILYSQNAFYKEAQREREEAITLSTKDDGSLYAIYYNASADAREQGNVEEWIQNLHKSLVESEKTPYKEFIKPNIYNTLITAHSVAGNLSEAEKYLKIVESEPEKYTSGNSSSYYLEAQKNYAFAKADYSTSLRIGKEHLASKKKEESFVEIYNAENFLAKTYAKLGNTAAANVHKNEYYRIKDSISNAQNVKSLAYYQTLYETEKRDATIAAQETNIALLDERNTVRNQWFLILAITGGVFFTLFYIRNRYEQKLQKRVAIEQLRTKISADLHDDVGSVLTGLAMQSELIERQVPDENKEQLRKVSSLSRDAMLQMRDAVWSMDARKDNWGSLIDRIKEFASENLQTKDIRYQVVVKGIDQSQELAGAIRQNLYLIAKEAIANILKHSTASQVEIALTKKSKTITLKIIDDGIVGTNNLKPSGLGLSNMQRRAQQLEGTLEVDQASGFQIIVAIPTT